MSQKRSGAFSTIRTQGGLLSAELLARVVDQHSGLDGLQPADYHLLPGERTGAAITRSWNRLRDAWSSFTEALATLPQSDVTATSVTRERWLLVLFDELGYGRLQTTRPIDVEGTAFPVSHLWGQVPIHLVGAKLLLDRRMPGVPGAAGASPHGLVQDLLNRSNQFLWGIASNGFQLRLLRDNASLTRQALVEFDVESMMADEVFVDFTVLWLCCHQSRLEGDPARCRLERWHEESATLGMRALDALRGGVQNAIASLGAGFLSHRANSALRQSLHEGTLTTDDYYRELLRLAYRLIFLFVAEDREVLLAPGTPDDVAQDYHNYYAVGRLRALAHRRRSGEHGDLWNGLQVVFTALGRLDGQPLLGLPSLGSFLWSEGATPHLDGAALANRSLLAAIDALAFTADGAVRRSVDFRNLGSEELGSVYESLLELHPDVDAIAGVFTLGTAAGHDRKTTGSYYTPTSLVISLLDSALDPVLDQAARSDDPETAILGLRVFDPTCGSGHFLVAAAHRMARRLAAVRTGEEEPAPEDVRHALRDIVGHCLFGVDVNPMAVELCKVSLWLEAVEPGRPLPFLDHHIVCGNSLLGTTPELVAAGIPDDAYKPLTGDDKKTVSSLRKRNKAERAGQGALSLSAAAPSADTLALSMDAIEQIGDDDRGDISQKEAQHQALVGSNDMACAKFVADLWAAAFVTKKASGAPEITTAVVRRAQEDEVGALDRETVEAVEKLARDYRFLHLHVAFPQVFGTVPTDADGRQGPMAHGGFDVVLGNPPWEKVKLAEKEFFSRTVPVIAAAAGAIRKKMIADLAKPLEEGGDPTLYDAYQSALHHAEAESAFLRFSGRYPLCGRGDVNTYAVFAELMCSTLRPSGRCGVIVPSGIATDDTTKHFFGDIVEKRSLVSLYEFENEGFFVGVGQGHMNRFCLLTLTGSDRRPESAEFMFRGTQLNDLLDTDRRFVMSAEELAILNPNTRTCPVFRNRRDAELTLGIYRRVQVLVADGPPKVNPWEVNLTTMFHMTGDSGLFKSAAQCEETGAILNGNLYCHPDGRVYLPLYEGKMIHHFNHRYGDYRLLKAGDNGHVLPNASSAELDDPFYDILPRYWVSNMVVLDKLANRWNRDWLLGFRDIAGSRADSRTVIASIIPRTAVGNNLPLLLSDIPYARFGLLGACLSSFMFDFVARQKVGGNHLNFFIVEQLPVLAPETFDVCTPWDPDLTLADWVVLRILELTFTAWDLAGFAADLGYLGPPFSWNDERRMLLRAEVDACFFHLYGVERDDVEYVMDTFPIVRKRDEAAYGEFRTARLILECYDAMAKAADSGDPYRTMLDPPPADPSVCHSEAGRPPSSERLRQ